MSGFLIITLGLIQTAWMIWAIRSDAADKHVSLIEAAILKASGQEPLPKSRIGLAFDRVLQWLGLLLGLAFVTIGFFMIVGQ